MSCHSMHASPHPRMYAMPCMHACMHGIPYSACMKCNAGNHACKPCMHACMDDCNHSLHTCMAMHACVHDHACMHACCMHAIPCMHAACSQVMPWHAMHAPMPCNGMHCHATQCGPADAMSCHAFACRAMHACTPCHATACHTCHTMACSATPRMHA